MVEFTLTLAKPLLQKTFRSRETYDVMAFVSGVPTIRYVSGNRQYSVRVAIEDAHVDALRRAVEGRCTISDLTDLDLLDQPALHNGSSRL